MIPVPTLFQLAQFSGRPESSYTTYAESALTQAAIIFTTVTEVNWGNDSDFAALNADDQQLCQWAIMAYADWIYLKQPYQQMIASPAMSETIGSYCVDEQTEILTQRGWLTQRELRPGDMTLGLDEETGVSYWQPVLSVHRFPEMRRKMAHFRSRRFNALTTLSHRWLTTLHGVPSWTTSDVLVTTGRPYRIPMAAPHAAPTEPKYSDALVELVAWLWTDGGWSWKGRHRGVRIHQSHEVNAANCARIRSALRAAFGEPSPSFRVSQKGIRCKCGRPARARGMCRGCYMASWRSGTLEPYVRPLSWNETCPPGRPGMTVFSLSAEASAVLTEHLIFTDKAVGTEFLCSLTQAQLLLFIEVSMLADRSGAKQLAQRSKRAAEQFMLACILAGRRVSIHENRYGMWSVTHTTDRLSILPRSIRQNSAKSQSRVEIVEFDGMVWCPRTPSRNWLARRDGTVYFTGNTYSKPPPIQVRNVQAQELGIGSTGVDLWDTAVQYLAKRLRANGVFFGQLSCFDRPGDTADREAQVMLRVDNETGERVILGPGDFNKWDFPGMAPGWNGEAYPGDPGVG